MTVSPVQPTHNAVGSSASTPASQASQAAGNYNAFLQLLITELKHQDPTKPLDPTQTVSQLATFSAVEQQVQTNALLAALVDISLISQASSLVGRTVTSADGKISGTVKSVTISNEGLVAHLANGKKLVIGSGVSIS